jgi:nitrogen regulatory protein PII
MFKKEEINEIKEKAKTQSEWSNTTVLELIQNIEVLEAMLKELEYTKDTGRIGGAIFKFCPICRCVQGRQKHKEDCRLKQVLELYR